MHATTHGLTPLAGTFGSCDFEAVAESSGRRGLAICRSGAVGIHESMVALHDNYSGDRPFGEDLWRRIPQYSPPGQGKSE